MTKTTTFFFNGEEQFILGFILETLKMNPLSPQVKKSQNYDLKSYIEQLKNNGFKKLIF